MVIASASRRPYRPRFLAVLTSRSNSSGVRYSRSRPCSRLLLLPGGKRWPSIATVRNAAVGMSRSPLANAKGCLALG